MRLFSAILPPVCLNYPLKYNNATNLNLWLPLTCKFRFNGQNNRYGALNTISDWFFLLHPSRSEIDLIRGRHGEINIYIYIRKSFEVLVQMISLALVYDNVLAKFRNFWGDAVWLGNLRVVFWLRFVVCWGKRKKKNVKLIQRERLLCGGDGGC